ncbi:MAG: hypothetical protein WCJ01_01255 [Ignavibacteria bacterium]
MQRILLFVFIYVALLHAQEKPVIETFLDGASVNQITGDQNELWISTYGKGIYHYMKKTGIWENFSTSRGNLQQDFFYCVSYNKDYVWAGCSDGLFTLDRKRNIWLKRKFGKGGEMGNWVRALVYDKYVNTLWIGRFKYLTRLEVANQKFTDIDLTIDNNTKTNSIKTIKLDGDSLVWFGTEVGIHRYTKPKDIEDPGSRQFITNKTNAFNGDGDIVSLADILPESKNIWFGLDEFITVQKPSFNIGGLYCYNRTIDWRRFDTHNGMNADGIYCLALTGNTIWASTYKFNKKNKEQTGQGIALINRFTKKVTSISKDELNLHNDKIIAMFFDGDSIWLGTEAGLVKIKIVSDFISMKKISPVKPSTDK